MGLVVSASRSVALPPYKDCLPSGQQRPLPLPRWPATELGSEDPWNGWQLWPGQRAAEPGLAEGGAGICENHGVLSRKVTALGKTGIRSGRWVCVLTAVQGQQANHLTVGASASTSVAGDGALTSRDGGCTRAWCLQSGAQAGRPRV